MSTDDLKAGFLGTPPHWLGLSLTTPRPFWMYISIVSDNLSLISGITQDKTPWSPTPALHGHRQSNESRRAETTTSVKILQATCRALARSLLMALATDFHPTRKIWRSQILMTVNGGQSFDNEIMLLSRTWTWRGCTSHFAHLSMVPS